MRDKRFDWLYERQKQPVREYVVEKLAEELAGELAAWPPPDLEWEDEDQRRRWESGAASKPRDEVVRYALEIARLDLRREWEAIEQRMAGEAARFWQTPAERAAGHLLVRLLTERCLALKEYAEGARLTRDDLVRALDLVERRLFRVTLG
ncbi:MAG TPA: hypothetical protein VFP50_12655 [Anaeromyxobacteraceae bacterium]|nr:hypothetical protein [Anaeromyxobacteraceae bacterium]